VDQGARCAFGFRAVAVNSNDRFRLLSPTDLDALPDPTWLIDGILPANAFCVLYGEPGSGKTFVGLSVALSIAAGKSWCGKITRSGSVLYIAAEGLFGLKTRVAAFQKRHSLVATKIQYLGSTFNLLNQGDIEGLIASLCSSGFKPDLVILDTLARLMAGADENSAKEMGAAIHAIDQLRSEFQASALVVHHTGKAGPRERGSSALRGAADAMLLLKGKPDSGIVSLECDKMKDAEPFQKFSLGLEKIRVGSLSSMAIGDWKEAIAGTVRSVHCESALSILHEQFGNAGATNSEWLKAWITATGHAPKTFNRTLTELKETGVLTQCQKRYFIKSSVPVSLSKGVK